MLIPYVIEQTAQGERSYDLDSRHLKDRNVFITGEVTEDSMALAVKELLFLNSEDKEKPIFLYVFSNGGSVDDGLALIDTMNSISAPVYTIAYKARSMGCAILAAGDPGHRYAMPSARVMVHPMSGGTGQERTRDGIISMNSQRVVELYLIGLIAHNTKIISDEEWEEVNEVVHKARPKNPNMVLKLPIKTKKKLDEFQKIYDFDHDMWWKEAKELGFIDDVLESEKILH